VGLGGILHSPLADTAKNRYLYSVFILGIETSTQVGSVALIEAGEGHYRLLAEISTLLSAAHSEKLVPYIDFVTKEADINIGGIDLIAVSIGPGSFTGLRVGVSTAKGLAFAQNIPVVGVDSLMVCASPYLTKSQKVAAFFDAKRSEVFGAAYEHGKSDLPKIIIPPKIMPIGDFMSICNEKGVDIITGDIFREDFAERLENSKIALATLGYNNPGAKAVATLGYILYNSGERVEIDSLAPNYLRSFVPGKPR